MALARAAPRAAVAFARERLEAQLVARNAPQTESRDAREALNRTR
jgi:hypothetical protein